MIYISHFIYLIFLFNIIVQIENISKKFELSQISDKFYHKLFKIYKNVNYPTIHLKQSLNDYKFIDKKFYNKKCQKSKNAQSLPNIKKKGK